MSLWMRHQELHGWIRRGVDHHHLGAGSDAVKDAVSDLESPGVKSVVDWLSSGIWNMARMRPMRVKDDPRRLD
jgi:hypothetical protein